MMNTYKLDDSAKHVKLEIHAGVVGIAVTRVYLKEDGVYKKLFDSDDFSGGNIPYTKVGINSGLEDKRVKIRTNMDISNLTPEQQKKAIDNILMMYYLDGGPDGVDTYEGTAIEIDLSNPLRPLMTKTIKFV